MHKDWGTKFGVNKKAFFDRDHAQTKPDVKRCSAEVKTTVKPFEQGKSARALSKKHLRRLREATRERQRVALRKGLIKTSRTKGTEGPRKAKVYTPTER